jgi:hypothetical protein
MNDMLLDASPVFARTWARRVRMGLLLAGALTVAQAQAQIYKCVDSSGKTVYGQSPCPVGADSSVLSRKPPAVADSPASKPAANSTAEQDMGFRKRQQERADAEKKAGEQDAEVKRKQGECQRAREQVAQYAIGGRISRMDDKGERYFLDDDQVAKETARAQADVARLCS